MLIYMKYIPYTVSPKKELPGKYTQHTAFRIFIWDCDMNFAITRPPLASEKRVTVRGMRA